MKVCIVAAQHISYNPRVLKEADALSIAGHEVTVLTVCKDRRLAALDEQIQAGKPWRSQSVAYRRQGVSETCRWVRYGVRQKIFGACARLTLSGGIAERAQARSHSELARLAWRAKAQLYIAHHIAVLPAAFIAARRNRAWLAFDAEDFESGMLTEVPAHRTREAGLEVGEILAEAGRVPKTSERRRVEYLEAKYLPNCAYITAASDGIGEAYRRTYPIVTPATILNVFPLEALPVGTGCRKTGGVISLYWYSATIGPGRGLEDAVTALSLLEERCQLHLQGTSAPDYAATLMALADNFSVRHRLFVHPSCPPADLVPAAARHDIGLALEPGTDVNNLLLAPNKIFTYMNAGLGIVATDTPGQAGVLSAAPGAGLVCRRRDPTDLARTISSLISSPIRLDSAKSAARRAAEDRFNWARESLALLDVIEGLPRRSSSETGRFLSDTSCRGGHCS